MYKVIGSLSVLCMVIVGCSELSDSSCTISKSYEVAKCVNCPKTHVHSETTRIETETITHNYYGDKMATNKEVTASKATHETETKTPTIINQESNLISCTMRTEKGMVSIVCGRETASGVPEIKAEDICLNPTENRVNDVILAMDKSGFDKVRSIAICGDVVGVVEKKVSNEGKNFIYKAITYTDGHLGDRVAIYSVIAEDGTVATPLEELLLVLANKIPFNAYGGMWFPHRTWGPAIEFGYSQDNANTKIEIVKTLDDGRIIKHITQNNGVPYFAIETPKKIKNTYVVTKEIQADNGVFPSDRELRAQGIIPARCKILHTDVSSVEIDGMAYGTKTISYTSTEEKDRLFVTCYPYYR